MPDNFLHGFTKIDERVLDEQLKVTFYKRVQLMRGQGPPS